jgi:Ser/Thr protein kinase RdoA (MazF antagonist)
VTFESELLVYLKTHQYPCPAPYQNKDGAYLGMFRGKPYMILDFIDGEHIKNLNEYHKQQVIHKVAELQNLTVTYQPRFKDYRLNYYAEVCRMLASTETQKINTQNAREKHKWFEHQLTMLDLPETLPKGICHCDFHFSNILFQEDQFVGLLDFDDANYTYLLFDLVCLIDSWAWPHQSNKLDLTQARKIVQEYIRFRPLSALEQKYMCEVHKLSILFDGIWFFERGKADDFYEKRKIEYLYQFGGKRYTEALFHP